MRNLTKKHEIFSLKTVALAALFSCLAFGAAQAEVYVGSSDFKGTYAFSAPNATGGFESGLTVTWDIGYDDSSELWTYNYTFAQDGSPMDPSHIILSVSDNFTSDNLVSANGGTEGPRMWGPGYSGSKGNPNLDEDFFGVKFDYESDFYTFVTDRMPVWGNVYAKKRKNDTAWNEGLTMGPVPKDGVSDYSTYWVPTPNAIAGGPPTGDPGTPGTSIPTPTAFLGGLLGMAVVASRRRR